MVSKIYHRNRLKQYKPNKLDPQPSAFKMKIIKKIVKKNVKKIVKKQVPIIWTNQAKKILHSSWFLEVPLVPTSGAARKKVFVGIILLKFA